MRVQAKGFTTVEVRCTWRIESQHCRQELQPLGVLQSFLLTSLPPTL